MDKKLCACGCGKLANYGKTYITGHNSVGRKKDPAVHFCKNCQVRFETMPYIKRRSFCSADCRDEYRSKLTGMKNPNYGRHETFCKVCGSKMLVTKSVLMGKKKEYCSIECGKSARRAALKSKKRKGHGKMDARLRDSCSCVICGFSHVTAVHHIIPKKEKGTDKLTNLVTLCPNHHYMAHANLIDTNELKKFAVDFYRTANEKAEMLNRINKVCFRD